MYSEARAAELDEKASVKIIEKYKLEESIAGEFKLFYERGFLSRVPNVFISLAFGLILGSIHAGVAKFEYNLELKTIFEDFSYLLAVLNSVGLFLVFNATTDLRQFIVNLILFLKKIDPSESVKNSGSRDNPKAYREIFLNIYRTSLIGKSTIIAGLSLGTINVFLGHYFGFKYSVDNQVGLIFTFDLQVFMIGFLGGVTIMGVVAVIKMIQQLTLHKDIDLMYFYPDQCAGTLVLGHILFKLSLHFIIIGIFIFLFLHNYCWTNMDTDSYFPGRILIAWELFPFLLSAIIFFAPTHRINRILSDYKLYERLRIRNRMNLVADAMIALPFRPKDDTALNNHFNHYEKLKELDGEVSKMNTWPYNLRYRAAFLGFALPVISAVVIELSKGYFSKLVNIVIK